MRANLPALEGSADRNGVKIYYEIYGDGDHTILFIPSWSIVHSRVYKAQVPYFSERFRCVTYDPRGNGKSDRPLDPEAYRLQDYVGDALAVLDAAGADKAILFGFSLSGLVCAALAAHAGIDPTGCPMPVATVLSRGRLPMQPPGRALRVRSPCRYGPIDPRPERSSSCSPHRQFGLRDLGPRGWPSGNRLAPAHTARRDQVPHQY